jgi:hypothetical protein
MWRRENSCPLPGFELRPLGRPAHSQSLYQLHCPSFSGPWGQTTNVSSTCRSHRDGLCRAESRASFSKCSMKVLLTMGDRERPTAMLEELIIHLKTYGSQTNFRKFHEASTCKRDCSAKMLSLWSVFLLTCRASLTDTLVKRLKTSKLTRVSEEWRFTDFKNCTNWPDFFTKDFYFLARGLNILWRKPARA